MSKAEFWGDFKTVFDDPAQPCKEVKIYDADVVEDYDMLFPVNDLNNYREIASRTGGSILELGAGTGRVLCDLVAHGHQVTGLDLSAPALEIARKRLDALPADLRNRARLVEGDATDFTFDETFELITIPACSIVLFEQRAARQAMFRRIAAHLSPGGLFAFDFPLLDWAQRATWDGQIVDLRFDRQGTARHIRVGARATPSRRNLEVNIHWMPEADPARADHMLERKMVLVVDAAEIERELAEAGLSVQARRTHELPDGGGRIRWLECTTATAPAYPLWHPHTAIEATSQGVLTLAKGAGAQVTDTAGNDFIDLASGLWSTPLGQGHEGVIAAVTQQLETLSYGTLFAGYSNPAALALSQKLVELAPANLGWCYLTNSGSESVDLAIKIARRYHNARPGTARTTIAYFDQSYHGTFFGSMGVSGLHPGQEASGPGLLGAQKIPFPVPRLCPAHMTQEQFEDECADAFEAQVLCPDAGIGALIFEPVLGSAGALVPSAHYLTRIERICRDNEVLMIADEVATGFGRCGTWFASTQLGITPDVLLLSKGISAGYLPLGAVVFSHEIGATLKQANMTLGHGSSHNGNPACCAAGLATIEALSDGIMPEGARNGARLKAHLEDQIGQSGITRIHGLGLMLGVELQQVDGQDLTPEQVGLLQALIRSVGVLTYGAPSGFVVLPPLIISQQVLDGAIARILAVLAAIRFVDGEVQSAVSAG